MNLRTKFWVQVGGVAFFAIIAIAELTQIKSPTFGHPWAPYVFVLASLMMVWEAWRTWRKVNGETTTNSKD